MTKRQKDKLMKEIYNKDYRETDTKSMNAIQTDRKTEKRTERRRGGAGL